MVNRGTNHLGIDRSKTAGGRKRRQAAQRKRQLREANLYRIAVKAFGLYREDGVWKLTAMKAKRSRERMVSDRQGGTKSETVVEAETLSDDPRGGLVIDTFDTKREVSESISYPDSWNKHDAGEYYSDEAFSSEKVDRDDWRDWLSHPTVKTER